MRTLWPSFEHAEAFERACRALRLVQVGDDALHSVRDLGLFLKAVSYCEEHWDAMEALDRVEDLLRLKETPSLLALRDAALRMANESPGIGQQIVRAERSSLIGVAGADSVTAYVEVLGKRELFFRAERIQVRNHHVYPSATCTHTFAAR